MKTHKGLKITGIVLAAIIVFIAIINIIPPKKNIENNPFIVGKGNLPMIAAHRGGGECNPENTMLAFREAVNTFDVEIIESDLYLTKDGYLVYNHDEYIDETCNVNGDISLIPAGNKIKKFLDSKNIKIKKLKEGQVIDIGSIIPLMTK